mmetsp:Transcript_45382/g.98873  ORF Transcript_45382/g.98873 Transcript_45382/m.98873 type:complete len:209 (-) Transcript_45382:317-943(-)
MLLKSGKKGTEHAVGVGWIGGEVNLIVPFPETVGEGESAMVGADSIAAIPHSWATAIRCVRHILTSKGLPSALSIHRIGVGPQTSLVERSLLPHVDDPEVNCPSKALLRTAAKVEPLGVSCWTLSVTVDIELVLDLGQGIPRLAKCSIGASYLGAQEVPALKGRGEAERTVYYASGWHDAALGRRGRCATSGSAAGSRGDRRFRSARP